MSTEWDTSDRAYEGECAEADRVRACEFTDDARAEWALHRARSMGFATVAEMETAEAEAARVDEERWRAFQAEMERDAEEGYLADERDRMRREHLSVWSWTEERWARWEAEARGAYRAWKAWKARNPQAPTDFTVLGLCRMHGRLDCERGACVRERKGA